jgi:hypothetical protein
MDIQGRQRWQRWHCVYKERCGNRYRAMMYQRASVPLRTSVSGGAAVGHRPASGGLWAPGEYRVVLLEGGKKPLFGPPFHVVER